MSAAETQHAAPILMAPPGSMGDSIPGARRGWRRRGRLRRCMHMHDNGFVRTTIEMKDEHRAALLELAARRRLKGFSALVEDAVEADLKADAARAAGARQA